MHMIFQHYFNNEVQLDISKLQFYDLMITSLCHFSKKVWDNISPDCLEILSIIKNELFEYLGLSLTEFDIFIKEVAMKIANNKENIDVPKLIDDNLDKMN